MFRHFAIKPQRFGLSIALILLAGYVSGVSSAISFFDYEPDSGDEVDPLFAEMREEIAIQGPCWVYAVDRLEKTKNNSRSQERLAFDFTNCFIEGVGLSGYHCPASMDLLACRDFIRLRESPHHGQVYAVFYLQSQLLMAYLLEANRQKMASTTLEKLDKGPTLAKTLATISDGVLDSIKTKDQMQELKEIASKSHEELRLRIGRTKQVLNDIYETVTNYQIFGVTVLGAALYATNLAMRAVL